MDALPDVSLLGFELLHGDLILARTPSRYYAPLITDGPPAGPALLAVMDVLAGIELRGIFSGMRLTCGPAPEDFARAIPKGEEPEILLRIDWTVPCRETGNWLPIASSCYFVPEMILGIERGALAEMIFKQVQAVVLHEFAESFRYQGALLHDPHA